jgi:hypothetical protein
MDVSKDSIRKEPVVIDLDKTTDNGLYIDIINVTYRGNTRVCAVKKRFFFFNAYYYEVESGLEFFCYKGQAEKVVTEKKLIGVKGKKGKSYYNEYLKSKQNHNKMDFHEATIKQFVQALEYYQKESGDNEIPQLKLDELVLRMVKFDKVKNMIAPFTNSIYAIGEGFSEASLAKILTGINDLWNTQYSKKYGFNLSL